MYYKVIYNFTNIIQLIYKVKYRFNVIKIIYIYIYIYLIKVYLLATLKISYSAREAPFVPDYRESVCEIFFSFFN